jgi:hypothetical protein
MSNRSQINDLLVSELKNINGRVSPYGAAYSFKTSVHNNVYRGLKYLDEINDFPSIYVTSGREVRKFNTNNNTEARVETTLRCYMYGDDVVNQINDLIQDVEHVIYNLTFDPSLQVFDISIITILTDSGLLRPYGMVEIFLSTRFEIFKI